MSDIYKGELQDYEGNTVYPHSEADVIFCTDGEDVQKKLNKYENAMGNVTGVTDSPEVDDSKILVSAKALHKVNSSLTANGSQLCMDYHDGKYGVNTDPERGADTFIPFRSDTGYEEVYIIKVQGNGVRNSNYVVDLFCIDSDKVIHNTTGYSGTVSGNFATLVNSGYSSGYHFSFTVKRDCTGKLNGSNVSYKAGQTVTFNSWYGDLTQFVWVLSHE